VDPDGRIPEKIIDHAAKAETKQSARQIQLFNSLQTQVKLRDAGYNINRAKNACVALTLMDAVQDYMGTALNQNQITSLLDSFYEKGIINSNNDIVQDKNRILNETLDVISLAKSGERSPYKAFYEPGKIKGADYTERNGKTRNPPFSGSIHSQLGDGNGNSLHDPWEGGVNRLNPDTENIKGSIFFIPKGE
jgi:hypothetical protein